MQCYSSYIKSCCHVDVLQDRHIYTTTCFMFASIFILSSENTSQRETTSVTSWISLSLFLSSSSLQIPMSTNVSMDSGGVSVSVSMNSTGSGVSEDEEQDEDEELTDDDDEEDVDEINHTHESRVYGVLEGQLPRHSIVGIQRN